jgi:hypothetical protein
MLRYQPFAILFVLCAPIGCASGAVGADAAVRDVAIDTPSYADRLAFDSPDTDRRDAQALVDRPQRDVALRDANDLIPLSREVRIDVIHAPRYSANWDELMAARLVPARPDGTGRTAFRSGDCVVENLIAPATERLAEHFYVRLPNQEIELTRTNTLGWLRWEDLARPLTGVSEVSLRATGANLQNTWNFTAQMPRPFSRLTAPSGVDQLPMSTILLAPDGNIPIAWDPSPGVNLVQVEFNSYQFDAALGMISKSTIRCLLSPAIASFVLVPADHPTWISPGREDSVTLNIDSIIQHRVPFGDLTAEVNLIYRQAAFPVAFVRP